MVGKGVAWGKIRRVGGQRLVLGAKSQENTIGLFCWRSTERPSSGAAERVPDLRDVWEVTKVWMCDEWKDGDD